VQEVEAKDRFAICVQHELDHLDGVLYIDYLSRLKRDRVLKKFQKAEFEAGVICSLPPSWGRRIRGPPRSRNRRLDRPRSSRSSPRPKPAARGERRGPPAPLPPKASASRLTPKP
jgi:hypothetical protein